MAQWLRIHLTTQGHPFDPRPGKIPHALQQLSLWAPTPEPVPQSQCTPTPEACAPEPELCKRDADREPEPATRGQPALQGPGKADMHALHRRPGTTKNREVTNYSL